MIKKEAIKTFFKDRPIPLKLFLVVKSLIESFGPTKVEVAITQVSFGTKRKFAWVWLPQMWIEKQLENSIVLTFALDHQVIHPKIKESVEPKPGKWTHHVVIEKESDIDENIRTWLREAYGQSQ